jgi:hypothetical protein
MDEACANHLVEPTEESGSCKDKECPGHSHNHHHGTSIKYVVLKFIKISLIVSHSLLLLDASDVDVIVEEETAYLDDGTPNHEKSHDPPPNMLVVDRAVVVVETNHSQSTAFTSPRCSDSAAMH